MVEELSPPGGGRQWYFFRSSYGWNAYTADPSEQFEAIAAVPETQDTKTRRAVALRHWTRSNIKGPSRIPFIFDCVDGDIVPFPDDQPPAYEGDFVRREPGKLWEYWRDTIKDACIDRHGRGSINAGFVDGSSRRVGLKELWTLKWHTQYDTSGPWTKAGGVQPEDWPAWMRRFKD
ncbi:MAG: hypothetical protein JW993_14255 [Sedimentisphaerales bacterium]|nr:hypothetical protein [Sedimentisphaerales bacterium]